MVGLLVLSYSCRLPSTTSVVTTILKEAIAMRTRIGMQVVVVVAVLAVWFGLTVPARGQLIPLELEVPQIAGLRVGVVPD
jgi:hypothetical protein